MSRSVAVLANGLPCVRTHSVRVVTAVAVVTSDLASALFGGMVVLAVSTTSSALAIVASLLTMSLSVTRLAKMVLGVMLEASTPLAGLGLTVFLQMAMSKTLLTLVMTESVTNFTTLAHPSATLLLRMSLLVAALALMLVVEMSKLAAQSAELDCAEIARMSNTLALAANMFFV